MRATYQTQQRKILIDYLQHHKKAAGVFPVVSLVKNHFFLSDSFYL